MYRNKQAYSLACWSHKGRRVLIVFLGILTLWVPSALGLAKGCNRSDTNCGKTPVDGDSCSFIASKGVTVA